MNHTVRVLRSVQPDTAVLRSRVRASTPGAAHGVEAGERAAHVVRPNRTTRSSSRSLGSVHGWIAARGTAASAGRSSGAQRAAAATGRCPASLGYRKPLRRTVPGSSGAAVPFRPVAERGRPHPRRARRRRPTWWIRWSVAVLSLIEIIRFGVLAAGRRACQPAGPAARRSAGSSTPRGSAGSCSQSVVAALQRAEHVELERGAERLRRSASTWCTGAASVVHQGSRVRHPRRERPELTVQFGPNGRRRLRTG